MSWLLPDLIVHSVRELTPEKLARFQVRGVLLDIDGTLKPHYATHVEEPVQRWLRDLAASGIKLGLLSNGKGKRLGPLAEALALPLFSGACKPLPFKCRRAAKSLELEPQQIALVGDQLFTDVACGRLAGMTTVFVETLSEKEPFVTGCKRPLERWLLRELRQKTADELTGVANAPC